MRRIKFFQSFIQGLSLFLLLSLPISLQASTPALERELSLTITNEKISLVLTKIQEKCGVIFSYSTQLFKDAPLINLQVKNKSVREVLIAILPANIGFKAKNNYIILKEKDVQKSTKTQKISGYVYDANTDKKLADVTIYDKKSLESATTDEYGYYSISVPAYNSSLTVNRLNYQDTAILIQPATTLAINNILLQPKSDSLNKKDSALWQKKLTEISLQTNLFLIKFNKYLHTMNVTDSLERDFQISFLPFIGTNHKLSGNVYNKLSFNILGGYSRGTKEFELGGLFNIDKENVKGVQIGGLYNLVGDSMKGVQIASLFNLNGKKTNGVQIAGLSNINGGSVKGVQIAGLLNKNETIFTGLQIAGLVNANQSSDGFHISGLVNHCVYDENSYSFAGLINSSVSGKSKVQVSTILNKTEQVGITQVALINIADTAIGVPVGLFSFVKKGLHQLEISADQVQYFNLNLRTGVRAFYNIASVGIQPHQGSALWSIGYGLGSSFRVNGNLRSDVSFSVKHLSIGSFYQSTSERLQLYWGIEYKFNPKLSIAAGPMMNWYVTDTKSENYSSAYNSIAPKYSESNNSSEGIQSQYWLGGQISLRFF